MHVLYHDASVDIGIVYYMSQSEASTQREFDSLIFSPRNILLKSACDIVAHNMMEHTIQQRKVYG